jgi:CRP-like cAMP-binding protein
MNPAELFKFEENTVEIAPGETLFRQGDPGDCMFVVLAGQLDVLVDGVSVEHSERGAILGEMALIDSSPRGATVVALTTSSLAKVDIRRFNFIIQQNPFFARHVMKVLADRLRHMNRAISGGDTPA